MNKRSDNVFSLFFGFLVVVVFAVVLLRPSQPKVQPELVIPELPVYTGAVPFPGTYAFPTRGSRDDIALKSAFMQIVRAHPDPRVSTDLALDLERQTIGLQLIALRADDEMVTDAHFKTPLYDINIQVNASNLSLVLTQPLDSPLRKQYVESLMGLLSMQVAVIDGIRDNIRVLGVEAMETMTEFDQCIMLWTDTRDGFDATCAFFAQWNLQSRPGLCDGTTVNDVTLRKSLMVSQCGPVYKSLGY